MMLMTAFVIDDGTVKTATELQAAIEKTSGETTITLGADIISSMTIPVGQNITLDLLGYMLNNETG